MTTMTSYISIPLKLQELKDDEFREAIKEANANTVVKARADSLKLATERFGVKVTNIRVETENVGNESLNITWIADIPQEAPPETPETPPA